MAEEEAGAAAAGGGDLPHSTVALIVFQAGSDTCQLPSSPVSVAHP